MKTTAIKAAKEAGKLIMKYYGNKYYIRHKTESDLVTQADLSSETLIKKMIKKKYPDHSILGEEYGHEHQESDYLWIIDPIDGTSNFVHHLGYFCISIAVEYKGKTILGVVYDPVKDELFFAENKKGAWLNGKRLCIVPKPKLIDHNLAFGFGKDVSNSSAVFKIVTKLRPNTQSQRTFGSFALDLCYVAANRFGISMQFGSKIWDIAAAKLILEEAGGIMTDMKGKKINLHAYKNIIASNKKIHKKILGLLK